MRGHLRAVLMLGLVIVAGSGLATGQVDGGSAPFGQPMQTKFKTVGGSMIVVPVTINGSGPFYLQAEHWQHKHGHRPKAR